MKLQQTILITNAAFLLHGTAFSQDAAPKLSLSQAAKHAEDAVAAARLPADCFVRSVTLVRGPDAAPYYRVAYKPPLTQRADAAADATPAQLAVMHVSMDGKVTFEQEEMRRRTRIINK